MSQTYNGSVNTFEITEKVYLGFVIQQASGMHTLLFYLETWNVNKIWFIYKKQENFKNNLCFLYTAIHMIACLISSQLTSLERNILSASKH